MNQIALFDLIREKLNSLNRTLLISIDGRAGAGKSTLAKRISEEFSDCEIIHMDDLYRGWLLTLGSSLTRELISIVEQLSEGGNITYSKFDWKKMEIGETISFSPPKILVIEGVGSGQSAISAVVDIKVWIDIDIQTGFKRVIERDGLGIKKEMESFLLDQEAHFTAEQTQERSDFQIAGN